MKILEPGHIYQLHHLDGTGASLLTFVNREVGTTHEGTQTQEVLRACIDKAKHDARDVGEVMTALINRTQHCDACLRWDGNDKIVAHLAGAMQAYADALKEMRAALVLHEARALERKVEKGELKPETLPTGRDGHFVIASPIVHLNDGDDGTYCQLRSKEDPRLTSDPAETTCARCKYAFDAGKRVVDALLPCQHALTRERDKCRHGLYMGTTCHPCLLACEKCWDDCASASSFCPRPSPLDEPKTTDYCRKCGESPESATHYGLGPSPHSFEDPRR